MMENEVFSLYLLVKGLNIKVDIDEAGEIFGKSVSQIVVFTYKHLNSALGTLHCKPFSRSSIMLSEKYVM